MNPYRTCQENMDALKKVLIQRTYVALANKNVEFVLKNQNASLDELAEYGYIDDVIEPRNTRFRVIRALQSLATKRLQNPAKKHSNIPL